jgi:hypothetical protein
MDNKPAGFSMARYLIMLFVEKAFIEANSKEKHDANTNNSP